MATHCWLRLRRHQWAPLRIGRRYCIIVCSRCGVIPVTHSRLPIQ